MKVLLALLIPVCLQAQTVPDSLFNEWKPNTPGGVVAVVQNGQVVYSKSFGLADVDKKIPNAPSLKYDLASNAKQFTAMSIALLEEQGKLSKEDPLRKYYPGLKIKDDIRIRNLIDHTSGLRDASVIAILKYKLTLTGAVKKKHDNKQYYIKCMMEEEDLNFSVGSEMAYTNFNYVLLADIVEKVSGQTLSAYMDSAIFKPLGMNNTLLRDQRKMKIENESVGYLFNGSRYKRSDATGGIVGDHNMVSTIDDLVRWHMNFRQNKLGKSDPNLITKISTASTLLNGETTYYGYGLSVSDYKGVKMFWHGGDDGRQTSMSLRFPDNDLSVIVLSNSSRYNVTEKIAFNIAEVFLQGTLVQPVVEKQKDDFKFITLTPAELQSRAGLYTRVTEQRHANMYTLDYVNGKLIGIWGNQLPGSEMSAVSSKHLIGKVRDGRIVSLKFDEDGSGFTYRFHTYEELHFKKAEPARNVHSDYRGQYENKSNGASLSVKKKRNKIVARKGLLKIPLTDFATDQFYGAENDVLFTFVRNEKGVVTSVRVDASDFRNFWFEKK